MSHCSRTKESIASHAEVRISVNDGPRVVSTQESLHFPMLDVLRAAATVSVLVFHAIVILDWTTFPRKGPLAFFRSGWLGVDLFFVLSGFVIGLSTFASIDKLGADCFRWEFMKRRLARILPLHYLTCFFYVLVEPQVLKAKNFKWDALAHAVFVHNLVPSFHGSINGPNWTLGIEMQFYIFMALAGPVLYKASIGKSWLALTATSLAWRSLSFYKYAPKDVAAEGYMRIFFPVNQLPGNIDQFAVGILLARVVRTTEGRKHLSQLQSCAMFQISTASFAVLMIFSAYQTLLRGGDFWTKRWMVIAFDTQLAIAAGALIVLACTISSTGYIKKATKPLRYLGTISYGIYLWHFSIMHVLKKCREKNDSFVASWDINTLVFLAIFATVCFASLSWHLLEKPIVSVAKKRSECDRNQKKKLEKTSWTTGTKM